jgi:ABC-type transport system involved in multi-copper enzyme maturation permease subunit
MSALGAVLWNPIVAKEVRSRMRTWRAPLVLMAFLAILGTVGYTAYRSTAPSVVNSSNLGSAGQAVFGALSGTMLILVALLVPGLVGGAISGERERQTLDLLLVTPVQPLRIVFGKLLSSLMFVLLLVIASVPLFSVVFILGGVELDAVIAVLVVTLVTAIALGALAMLCSTLLKRTTSSTVSGYITAFLLFTIPLVLGALIYSSEQSQPQMQVFSSGPFNPGSATIQRDSPPGPRGAPSVIYASPATAMFGSSYLHISTATGCVVQAFSNGPGGGFQSRFCNSGSSSSGAKAADTITSGMFSGWRYWEAFSLIDGVIAVLALVASVLVLRGRLPRPRRGGGTGATP